MLGPQDWTVEDRGFKTPCWIWIRTPNNKGYGVVCVEGKMLYAHRAVYEQEVGPILEGLELDHLCRVPRCVRPSHAEPVTHAVNLRRGKNTKLTPSKVAAIRADTRSHVAVAAEYGVHASHVLRIRSGEVWKTLDV